MPEQIVGRAWIGVSFVRGTPELWEAKRIVQRWMDQQPDRVCRVRANVYGRFDMFVGAEWIGSASAGIEKALSELSGGTGQNFEFQSQTYFVIKDMLVGTGREHGDRGIRPSVEQRLQDPNPWRQKAQDEQEEDSFDDKHCIVVGIRVNPALIPRCAEEIRLQLAALAPQHGYTLDQVTGDLDLILTMAMDPDRAIRIEATHVATGLYGRPQSLFDVLRSIPGILATETFIGHGLVS